MRFPCVSYVIIISTVRSGVFWQLQYKILLVQANAIMVFSAGPRRGLFFWAIKGWCMWMHAACYSVTLTQLAQLKKCHKRLPIGTLLLFFVCVFLLKVFTQVDPSILTDFTSPSTLHFHRQSQISRFSTRTLGSVRDLSRSLFLIDTNWHWHVETRRIDLIETRSQCGSNSMLLCCPRLTSKWEFSWCRTNSHLKSDGHGVSILRVFLTNCASLPWHWVHKLERKLQMPYTGNSSLQKNIRNSTWSQDRETGAR